MALRVGASCLPDADALAVYYTTQPPAINHNGGTVTEAIYHPCPDHPQSWCRAFITTDHATGNELSRVIVQAQPAPLPACNVAQPFLDGQMYGWAIAAPILIAGLWRALRTGAK